MPNYTTTQGDTWDMISLRVYNNEKFMHTLVDANHQYRNIALFPANCELVIPELPRGEKIVFPPWRVG